MVDDMGKRSLTVAEYISRTSLLDILGLCYYQKKDDNNEMPHL